MTPAERDAVTRHAGLFQRPVAEVLASLEIYADLLVRWQKAQNLVSRETLPELWVRHFADSLQLLPLLGPRDRRIVDLGSGAGFPALPLAIASGTSRTFTLLEPNLRKAAFLRTVARETGTNATILDVRIEEFDSRETIDVVTSRAMAPLADLLELAERLLAAPTRGLFHKGREHLKEIEMARRRFAFDMLLTESEIDSHSVVIEIAKLSRIG